MSRVTRQIASRFLQASFIRKWHAHNMLHGNSSDTNPIRQHCPRLFGISVSAVEKLDPYDFGYFMATVKKYATMTLLLLLHDISAADMTAWIKSVAENIKLFCPFVELQDWDAREFVALLVQYKAERRGRNPQHARLEARFVPLDTRSKMLAAVWHDGDIVASFFAAWMAALHPAFRAHVSFWQFVRMSRGFRHGQLGRIYLVSMRFETGGELHDDNYKPVGDLIPLEAFCTPVLLPLGHATCVICVEDVLVKDAGGVDVHSDSKPVVTSCGHYFHETCLNVWVNESGMSAANTCPSCRMEICVGRARVPESVLAERRAAMQDP